ncbi:hypothetical protein H6G81_22950 [Scytonema hofmannii FACHB-248]|uniref:Uncharacterized protein n=1 Tax=Scytonema hofmannii FACHB-248 TaxID=1842502 RepID=A0ABR8GUW9_9CYAN|nr:MULTISPECIES: hypothetical protein [Nostocales]MBD2607309.1 hypothetical protein [Scytonema hofmannii FACHB-248]
MKFNGFFGSCDRSLHINCHTLLVRSGDRSLTSETNHPNYSTADTSDRPQKNNRSLIERYLRLRPIGLNNC